MISLANIREVTATLPPRLPVHGLEGVGKTSLATRFPKPVFLQTEDGIPAGLKLATFGLLSSYADVRDALAALGSEPHGFQTVVLDSLDKFEGLVWADVCATNKWPSIETLGFGKGYVIADRWWRDFLAGLDWLRRDHGMAVVLLAHSAIETVNDPRTPAYTSYQLRLHKRARGLDFLSRHGCPCRQRRCRLQQEAHPCRWWRRALVALRGPAGFRCQVTLRPAAENSLSKRFRRRHFAGADIPDGRTGNQSRSAINN